MPSKFVIGTIIVIVLFGIGVFLVSIAEFFSNNWLIGIGLIGVAIAIIVVVVYSKARSE